MILKLLGADTILPRIWADFHTAKQRSQSIVQRRNADSKNKGPEITPGLFELRRVFSG
jgi:hypothetical protein